MHNYVTVIVRGLGVVFIAIGVVWLVHAVVTVLLGVSGAPSELWSLTYRYALQGVLSGPLFFIAGFVVLRKSEWLTALILRGTRDEAV